MRRLTLPVTVAAGVLLAGCGSDTTAQQSASPTAPPTSASPSPTARPTPTSHMTLTRKQALKLSDEEARLELAKQAQLGAKDLKKYRGKWLPQVSEKCEGLDVDIKPNLPDGSVDTYGVTAPEILGFHASLGEEYAAFTVDWTDLTGAAPVATCYGQTVWVAFVPRAFKTADKALRWCEASRLPYGECGARQIPKQAGGWSDIKLPQGSSQGTADDTPSDLITNKDVEKALPPPWKAKDFTLEAKGAPKYPGSRIYSGTRDDSSLTFVIYGSPKDAENEYLKGTWDAADREVSQCSNVVVYGSTPGDATGTTDLLAAEWSC